MIFVIFGGLGDLTHRKIMPALYALFIEGNMPSEFSIILVDRVKSSETAIKKSFSKWISADKKQWSLFAKNISYLSGDFTKQSLYSKLQTMCKGSTSTVFYMATPPSMFYEIPKQLHKAGLTAASRIVVEKPIGFDARSADEINTILRTYFAESQIFRIDHYLGKETVQNILALRFANPLFEPLWNRRYIEYVTISVAETVGVEHRAGYYEKAGALRDMVQNHLMQLLCLIAMEPMVSFDAEEIRNKKIDVLHAVRPIHNINEHAVRGQYAAGRINGKKVCG
jgi:glucose-6-phosphate 1-dehydrogenase